MLSPNSPYGANKRHSKDGRLSTISSATFESSLGSPFFQSHIDSPDIRALEKSIQPLSARYQRCVELQQTERNYVDVLKTIVEVIIIEVFLCNFLYVYIKCIYKKRIILLSSD